MRRERWQHAVRLALVVNLHARRLQLLSQRICLLEVTVALRHNALQQQRVQLRLLLRRHGDSAVVVSL